MIGYRYYGYYITCKSGYNIVYHDKDFEEDSVQLNSDEGGVVKVKDGTELAEKDSVVEGDESSTWANQVTLKPQP